MKHCSFACALLLLSGLAAPGLLAGRLSHDVEPTRQLVNLTVDPAAADYSGSVSIDLTAHRAVTDFRLHSEGLSITSLRLTDADDLLRQTSHAVNEDNELVVTIPDGIAAGNYHLNIAFENLYDTQAVSLYRVTYDSENYLFTQMEADEAREAFPCFDEPSFKIPWQITLRVPTGNVAVSNTPVQSEASEDGTVTLTFKQTRPLPSYLIAICVGPFDVVPMEGLGVPAHIYTPRGQGEMTVDAAGMTPSLLAALEEYFASPYPYEKLDFIAVPEFWPGAMENAGAITYAQGLLVNEPGTLTIPQRRRMASTIAHELAHQWFGNLVTMEWWDDLWLNEAFASWMGDKITDQVHPEFDLPISVILRANYTLDSDARPSSQAIRQPEIETAELLTNIGAVYYKGQSVLSMFEQWSGEENFRQGILKYLEVHRWGNATSADLWDALQDATGRDIPAAMKTFIDQPGAPLVLFDRAGQTKQLQLVQRRMANYGVDALPFKPWFLPLSIRYSCGGIVHDTTIVMSDTSMTVSLSGDGDIDWVMPQADGLGYYRWSLPPKMMLSVAENAVEFLTPAERIAYLGNLSALLSAGAISGHGYLAALQRFANDPNLRVASTTIGNLGEIREAFVTDDTRADFAAYVRSTLGPVLDRIGLEPIEGEEEDVTNARPTVIAYLADEGSDTAIQNWGRKKFAEYLDDPSSVDRSLVNVVTGVACMYGDSALYLVCRERFEQATTPRERGRFLSALASFRDYDLQRQSLDYALRGPLQPQEVLAIPQVVGNSSSDGADLVVDWLISNYDTIIERIPPAYRIYLPTVGSGCSRERLARAMAFYNDPARRLPGLEQVMDRVKDGVQDCVSLREREIANVAAYLAEFQEADSE